ncbi:hypothetical protein HMN09_01399600 [Mycena chlorophos]|uniref:LysM domain-containing protein n=1 Tax=Mycena chlorophos TaxID=658473 RepID=A0A8H6RWW0_MYCCL|nr:hypothetical protein HMN09_01399600 [Mycena chlorophos]
MQLDWSGAQYQRARPFIHFPRSFVLPKRCARRTHSLPRGDGAGFFGPELRNWTGVSRGRDGRSCQGEGGSRGPAAGIESPALTHSWIVASFQLSWPLLPPASIFPSASDFAMRLSLGALLLGVRLVAASPAGTFKDKLDALMADTNKAFHDALLKQLQNSRLPVPQTDVELDNLLATGPVRVEALNTSTIRVDASVIGFTLYTTDNLPTNPAPSSACASALTASINCNSTISTLGIGTVLTDAELDSVCTSSCSSSLTSYRANVVSACKGYAMVLDPTTNVSYAPTLTVDYIDGPYNVQCLKDSTSGQFCSDVIDGFDATDGIPSLPKNELCSFCTLSVLNTTLLSSVLYSSSLESLYDAIATTCGVPPFNPALISSPVVSPGTPFGVNGTSSAVEQCELLGRNVTVSAETSCEEVAADNSVSYYDVYISNSLPSTNCTVLANTQLCLPQSCTTYTIAVNDTCAGIADTNNITSTQLLSYNPNLGTACQNIDSSVGAIVCVSPHGGFPNVTTSGGGAGAPSGPATTLAPVPTPTGNGSTAACGQWALALAGDFCSTFALRYAITVTDLYTLNPEINSNCTNLLAEFYYCVQPYPPFATVTSTNLPPTGTNYSTISTISYTLPPPVTTGTAVASETLTPAGVPAPTNVAPGTRTAACGYYYDIESGDTIDSISNISAMSTTDLLTWNPELSTSLPAVGLALCVIFPTGNYTLIPVTPPSNVSPFSTVPCADYYTLVANDTCTTVAARQSISQALFLSLNPGLTCQGLEANVAYCDFPLTPVQPGAPSNIATGTFTNCTTYYTIASGDTCTSVDEKYNTSLTDLLRWNPSLTASCTTIGLGEAYCVTGGGDPCPEVYTVVPNDSCGAIESKFSITLNDIIAWNPFLDSSCAIQVGENLCVSGTPANGTGSTGPPANIASGTLTNCTEYYTIASGNTCTSVDEQFNIALEDLLRWNTALTASCTTIQLGSAYCVAGGGDQCSKIYNVVSGDSCSAIESKFSITSADLLAWNPFLGSSCAIQIGQNLCVSGTAATTPPTGPPSNLASGSLSNCTSYYTVASGDTCTSIDEKYDTALADLLRWNTALTASCTTIQLGEAYCVQGGGNPCSKIYTVVSGDSCGAIESKFGITMAQMLSLNPFLTSSCAIQVGQNLCV